jgi:hypothetical protein
MTLHRPLVLVCLLFPYRRSTIGTILLGNEMIACPALNYCPGANVLCPILTAQDQPSPGCTTAMPFTLIDNRYDDHYIPHYTDLREMAN